MRINEISYSEFVGGSQEWKLDKLMLRPINLIVGKNATGKSRCLNLINGLAVLLSGRLPNIAYSSGAYKVVFDHEGKTVNYILEYDERNVLKEYYAVDGNILLERGNDGKGKIFTQELERMVQFQAPTSQLAAVVRRDSIQHPFMELLYQWASHVLHFSFGSSMGKECYALINKEFTSNFDPRNTEQVIGIFRKGMAEHSVRFRDMIISNMSRIGYDIEDIGTKSPRQIHIHRIEGEPQGLYVKEKSLTGITEQFVMSQGMFRALSIIIQIAYSSLSFKPSCIIIDDIGEGLDYERSCALIDLMIEEAKNNSIQLIMATNDRFVMNKVPLEAWSLLQRVGSFCKSIII
jgi:energy-coupling factor transporter ATP-binding protein EcfA2